MSDIKQVILILDVNIKRLSYPTMMRSSYLSDVYISSMIPIYNESHAQKILNACCIGGRV